MADSDEDPVGLEVRRIARDDVLQPYMGDGGGVLAAADLLDGRVPDHVDLGMLEQPILQNALGAQGIPAMNQRDLGGEVC
jgi:hypothetical protein